jgi:hypothetical protein
MEESQDEGVKIDLSGPRGGRVGGVVAKHIHNGVRLNEAIVGDFNGLAICVFVEVVVVVIADEGQWGASERSAVGLGAVTAIAGDNSSFEGLVGVNFADFALKDALASNRVKVLRFSNNFYFGQGRLTDRIQRATDTREALGALELACNIFQGSFWGGVLCFV